MCAGCCYVAAALHSLCARICSEFGDHAGLAQVGVVNRSNLPCEVVGKGREKLLEDFAKHVLLEFQFELPDDSNIFCRISKFK